jgi:AcrR family transcriptional regulator
MNASILKTVNESKENLVIASKKSEAPLRGRGRPRLFDRAEALSRALPLFWEQGYEGTSMAQLTAALGINAPALYSAFGSKEALFREVVGLYFSDGVGFNPTIYFDEPTAYDVVERILYEAAAAYTATTHPRGCMVATGMLGCAPEHRSIASEIAEFRRATKKALEIRFREARLSGDLLADTDVASLAGFCMAVLQGLSVQARDGANYESLKHVAAAALHTIRAASTSIAS